MTTWVRFESKAALGTVEGFLEACAALSSISSRDAQGLAAASEGATEMRIPLYYRVLSSSVHELPRYDWDARAKIEFVTTSGGYYTILGKHLHVYFGGLIYLLLLLMRL